MAGLLLPCSLGLAATNAANDADFVAIAADGGKAEVTTAQLAAQRVSASQQHLCMIRTGGSAMSGNP